ncbi:hypothetical protein BGZ93_010281 [Podila epicladia]|nr:hypothetical protein BGZ93_010281 [Podila epicladia]
MHNYDTSVASKLHAHNNLLRGIETNRGKLQHEQQDLIGQFLGYTHSEQQHDFQTLLRARTSQIFDASPAELTVYPSSHQDARKQSERSSAQSYQLSSGRKGTSMSSEMELQAIAKAKSSFLVTVQEQPSSENHLQYAKSDIDQEQKDKEDAELNRLCRRRCISTSEAEPLSPILPLSSSLALRHQASRRLSCGGRLETYLETEQVRSTDRDKGKGIYRSKRNSLTISTSFPETDALRDTSMSSASDAGSDRRASISSSISDISISLTHSTVSLSSSSSSTSIHDIPRKGGPPVHYTLMCWIGGRWPCKLRPLIKSALSDIHTTLRRNLKLPANYYIDIEFQWQGNTYMILDATHWQWAREQVNHGDMAIRCNIWQKRYTR